MKAGMAAMLLAAAAIASATVPAAAQNAPAVDDELVRYTVRPGDTLIGLQTIYLISGDSWAQVQAINQVANPRRMPIGLLLRIPRRLLRGVPIEANVFAFRGAVTIGGKGGGRAARTGLAVGEGDSISTAANAFVTVRLADGSRFSLPSNSRVGIRRLRKILLTGEVERAFAVERGRGEWQVAPSPKKDPFTVTTPVATAAVRGTEFRVEAGDGEQADRASFGVVEGAIAVEATNGTGPLLAAGTGVAASGTGVGEPVPLLPAPVPTDPERVYRGDSVALATAPVTGARRYRFALSLDAEGQQMVASADRDTPDADFQDIANGRYFARASAIDGQNIEGFAATWPVVRQRNTIAMQAVRTGGGAGRSGYAFRWWSIGRGAATYRFLLSRDRDGRVPVKALNGLETSFTEINDLADGTYWWRVWTMHADTGGEEAVTEPEQLVVGAGE